MSREDDVNESPHILLTFDIPPIPWPYFWEMEVGRASIDLSIKRILWWWPLRMGQMERFAYAYVSHKGNLTQDTLDELSVKGWEMAKQLNPKKDVKRQLKAVTFVNAKPRIRTL